MAEQKANIRKIKIQTGVVKRLAKEKQYYKKEAASEQEKFNKMVADGKDEHSCKKQEEVFQESRIMIPDTQRKLKKGCEELESLLETYKELAEEEEYKTAQQQLKDGLTEVDAD